MFVNMCAAIPTDLSVDEITEFAERNIGIGGKKNCDQCQSQSSCGMCIVPYLHYSIDG